MTRALPVLILSAVVLLAGCDSGKKSSHQTEPAASAPAAQPASSATAGQASRPVAVEASAAAQTEAGSFQVLADNRAIIDKYTAQKADAEAMLSAIQATVAGNQSALATFRRDGTSTQIAEHTQKLQALSDQVVQKFGVGIMSPPLGECGALGDAAFEQWQEMLQARAEGRKADPSYKTVYLDGVDDCRKQINNPPQPQVTVKLRAGAAVPAEGCRKVPEFSSTGESIDTGKMVCPAEAIEALK